MLDPSPKMLVQSNMAERLVAIPEACHGAVDIFNLIILEIYYNPYQLHILNEFDYNKYIKYYLAII